ncbi:MAG: hypothetical protein KAT65_23250 [Methanophagales archaeon]|nr:hypothetical protein [Methanophagales archaeon]
MSEQDVDIELRTHSDDADDYIKQLKEEMKDLPDAEKAKILLEKTRYWYGSAIEWRGFYEVEIQRRKEI